MSHAYYNSATAADLNCQNDLIDVMAKLMAGKCKTLRPGLLTALTPYPRPVGPDLFPIRTQMPQATIYVQFE